MSFSQSFKLAIKALQSSKMRALLTMLGIIIGVAAVIVITSLGNGMRNYMNDQFEQLGSNLIQVQIMGRGGTSRTVRPADMYKLVEDNPEYFKGVSPYVTARGLVRHGTDEFERTSIYGVSEFYYDEELNQTIGGQELAQGRFLSYLEVDRNQHVCIIGSHLEQEAFRGDALGKTLTVQGAPYTVIGVFAEKGDSTAGSSDDVIIMPYENALRLTGSAEVNFYMFSSVSKDVSTPAKAAVENLLLKVYGDSDYYFILSSAEMMDAMDSMIDTLMAILVLIAAISLLVGGIGIMNIMLVSVTERTREIGIRKSLGAKQRDIRSQFIIEAATTSAIGGTIGIFLGILMANVLSNVIALLLETGNNGFVAVPTIGGIAVSFGVSVAVGIFFGYMPANKAAKLNPIDALRYE